MKAATCRRGKQMLEEFCREHEVAFERCGKVVVATSEAELPQLAKIAERAVANGVQCEPIERARLVELEPHAAGIRALHVPETGIVDYLGVCERLAALVRLRGGEVLTQVKVCGVNSRSDEVVLETKREGCTAIACSNAPASGARRASFPSAASISSSSPRRTASCAT
jgi:L-2-hydroxyglutarate oxidase